jgi:antitoxin CcdA
VKPTFDSDARKRSVVLMLNSDLVDLVSEYDENLSAVVEKLLIDYLEQERLSRLNRHSVSAAASAAWNTFNTAHGSIADEFSSL